MHRQPGGPSWPRSAIECTPVAPRCVSRLQSSSEQVLRPHRTTPPVACVGPARLPIDGVKHTRKLTRTLDFCQCLRKLGASRWDVIRPCVDSKCSTFASHLLHARTHLSLLSTHGASENTSPPRWEADNVGNSHVIFLPFILVFLKGKLVTYFQWCLISCPS